MKVLPISLRVVVLVMLATLPSGCFERHRLAECLYQTPPSPAPLGTRSDAIWKIQEANAEASDFVIPQNEFEYNGVRLNLGGEDHVKQIAARLQSGADVPVVVERSMTSVREDSEYQYPVNPNPVLDLQRRELVVKSLGAMGVADADQRVVVAPAYVPGMKATEAAAAYQQSFMTQNYGGFGGYGGFGSFGGGSFGSFSGFR